MQGQKRPLRQLHFVRCVAYVMCVRCVALMEPSLYIATVDVTEWVGDWINACCLQHCRCSVEARKWDYPNRPWNCRCSHSWYWFVSHSTSTHLRRRRRRCHRTEEKLALVSSFFTPRTQLKHRDEISQNKIMFIRTRSLFNAFR